MTNTMTETNGTKEFKKTILTLVIYTPGEGGYRDRWGDYHEGKESSLNMEYFESKEDNSHEEEIGKRMGKLKFENEDVELKLLFNGIEPYNEPEYFYEDNTEEGDKIRGSWDYIETVSWEHEKKLKSEEEQRKLEEQRIKAAQEVARREQEKKAQEERERAEFLRLKAIYGN